MWENTTHDWAATVDIEHLEEIRRDPERFAPGGAEHLVYEVLAYAAEEAEARGGGVAVVTVHSDGSISVADDGRGTDTRVDEEGRPIRKPVMATRDLRHFDSPHESLPDGNLRWGMSAVAALSDWLVHTNRREQGSWTQRYERGIPVTDLMEIESDGTTGTTVQFRPISALRPATGIRPGPWGALTVDILR